MKAVCKWRILKVFAYFVVCGRDIPNWIIFVLLHKYVHVYMLHRTVCIHINLWCMKILLNLEHRNVIAKKLPAI